MNQFEPVKSSSEIENENLVRASAEWQTPERNFAELGQTDGGHEASSLYQVPKIFEALVTLIVCGLLLALSLLIIKKTKLWCSNPQPHAIVLEEDEDNSELMYAEREKALFPRPSPIPSESVDSTTTYNKMNECPQPIGSSVSSELKVEGGDGKNSSCSPMDSQQWKPQEITNKNSSVHKSSRQSHRVKGDPTHHVTFVRRSSGPFGDDVLAYAEETYHKVKDLNKEPKDDKLHSWARKFSSRRLREPRGDPERTDQVESP